MDERIREKEMITDPYDLKELGDTLSSRFTVSSLIETATAGVRYGYLETYRELLCFLRDIRDSRGLNISDMDLERLCEEILRRGYCD